MQVKTMRKSVWDEEPVKFCPRCSKRRMYRRNVMNSISRTDNKTYICNNCGDVEASMTTETQFFEEWAKKAYSEGTLDLWEENVKDVRSGKNVFDFLTGDDIATLMRFVKTQVAMAIMESKEG